MYPNGHMSDHGDTTTEGDLVDLHIPAPRQEMTAEEVRERIASLAPSTLELRKRLGVQKDD